MSRFCYPGAMEDLEGLLRHYLEALSEVTRADILGELTEAGELTATQVAKRLGLTVGNVYHHFRVLNRLGVLSPPRIVPGPTYVEKYYAIHPDILRAIQRPDWIDATQQGLSIAQGQAFWVAFCAHVGHMLLRASARYAEMTPEAWYEAVLKTQMGMISVRNPLPGHYEHDLARARAIVTGETQEDEAPRSPHLFIIAALPGILAAHAARGG